MNHKFTSDNVFRYVASGVLLEIFAYFATSSQFKNTFICSCVNDCIEHMATFTALAIINSTKCFCNTMVAGLSKIFLPQKFWTI